MGSLESIISSRLASPLAPPADPRGSYELGFDSTLFSFTGFSSGVMSDDAACFNLSKTDGRKDSCLDSNEEV